MQAESEQKNKLGFWTSTSLVVGNMIGAGVFMMPAALAAYGSISLVGWMVSTTGAFILAKIFCRLSCLMPFADGGPYAYSRRGLGNFAGFLVAWGYWISVWCTNAAIAVSLVSALSTFFPVLNGSPVAAVLTGLGLIWFLTWVNTRGILASGKLQLVTTILKIVPLLLVAVGGIFYIRLENFIPFNAGTGSDISAISATATYTFFAFLGLECATIPSGSVSNAEKTIPRATMTGIGITALIYILSTICVMGIIPGKNLQHSVTPFTDAAVVIWGSSARYLISAGIVVAAFGALNGWILIQGQMPYAIAVDHLFPRIFSKKNKRGAPAAGIVISSIVVSVLMAMNYTRGLVEQFRFLILLSTLTVLVPYLFSTASFIIIRSEKKSPGPDRGRNAAYLLAAASFIFLIWAIAGSGKEIVYWGFLLLMAGLPFYLLNFWKNKS
jgi:basic amino acid/polyamine antiporter, APA family